MGVARGITSSGYDSYDIVLFVEGKPTAAELVLRFVAARYLTLPANLSGSYALAVTGASAPANFTLQVNGATWGLIGFPSSATGSMPFVAAITLAPGDMLTLIAPASVDSTLADISFTLALVR